MSLRLKVEPSSDGQSDLLASDEYSDSRVVLRLILQREDTLYYRV